MHIKKVIFSSFILFLVISNAFFSILDEKANAQNTNNVIISETSTYSISGYLSLVDSAIGGSSDNCYGTGGYDDIESFMPVTIWDNDGKIIATGKTEVGKRPDGEYSSVVCNFSFNVDNIPKSNFLINSILLYCLFYKRIETKIILDLSN